MITSPGPPEVLKVKDVPAPVPGPEDVLVQVRAAAVNRADLLQRRGRYAAPPDSPADVPGLEFAGEVARCGDRVRSLQVGDRVMGLVGGGAYAEQVAVHERLCMRVPPGLAWEAAGAVPEAFVTAFDALFRLGSLAAGEVALVQAAGSGVGTAAVQLARVAGARVIGLARTADKRLRLERLGVDLAPDPARPDVAETILLGTRGEGVDLVLDLVGAAAWPLHERVLRERGRLVVVGLLGGARVEIDLGTLMRRRLTLVGTMLRSRSREEKAALIQEFAARILPLLTAGRVAPVVHCTFALEQAAEAHALMERDLNFGKIVLRP